MRSLLAVSVATLTVVGIACSSSDHAASPTPDAGSTPLEDAGDAGDAGVEESPLVKERPYAATAPSTYDPAVATPLVLLLHGYSSSAADITSYFQFDKLAEEKKFLLAAPDGLIDSLGLRFWNAGDACCNFDANPVDDVAYLHAVIDDMKAKYNVDRKRVYVVGHSNGGFMAYRLACELASEVAAIVSVAGAARTCTPSNPVAVLQVHGDADEVIDYGGGTVAIKPGMAPYPSAAQSVATWATNDDCDAELVTTSETLDLVRTKSGPDTTVARHACTKGAAELWTIQGGKHTPSWTTAAPARLYDFLQAHPQAN